jgi:hypothetical protein
MQVFWKLLNGFFKKEKKLESNNYKKVYVTLNLSEQSNQLLTESAKRSNRKKVQEAKLRLADHLNRFRSISELDVAMPY